MLKPFPLHNHTYPMSVLLGWADRGELLLEAPYQRGHVWGEKRQANLIRSIMLGMPISNIILNDRLEAGGLETAGFVVVDGKQRCTALLRWMRGELQVPGDWFGLPAKTICWHDLSKPQQLKFGNRGLAAMLGQLPTLEDEEEVYDLVNFGGVPHGEFDTD